MSSSRVYDYVIKANVGDDATNIFFRINNWLTMEEPLDFEKVKEASKYTFVIQAVRRQAQLS